MGKYFYFWAEFYLAGNSMIVYYALVIGGKLFSKDKFKEMMD
eukprot:CAMPEP_0202963334 /NCGR_PEP_ID=MMETSP1396-20130829/7319_1 /ASSEMBLY_ACC=CAM_ASM_000872 /TAXON_ID= /ORGANISM="Pseudokeronopsis sp., Strain Brazil" /LENGTH=41 /DNA_ID= /DNA_START= /DNA_END= /DNA_ORIENTATION=